MKLRFSNEINIKNIISSTTHFNNCTIHYLKRVVRVHTAGYGMKCKLEKD